MAKILVVDDAQEVLERIERVLTDAGHEVHSVLQGAEVEQRIADLGADLLLLDIHMPELDGLEVCRQLRQTPETAKLPIILISAEDRAQQVKLGKQVGANDCLEKPLDEHKMLAKINRYLA